ncbi:transposase [Caldanaerobacter sp.]|uniref:transposase n=1 Tax=Caldanaerobacter sp. TaxID=2930036 RepID=UPI003C787DBB
MPRKPRVKRKSGYYHVMLRRNEKKNIFRSNEDKKRFIEILAEKKLGGKFYLTAFCLMNNHVHLMIKEGNEDLSSSIKRIAGIYASYFNKKYDRAGHLFQDRFRSEPVGNESYVIGLVRYIHQKPVKTGLVKEEPSPLSDWVKRKEKGYGAF